MEDKPNLDPNPDPDPNEKIKQAKKREDEVYLEELEQDQDFPGLPRLLPTSLI